MKITPSFRGWLFSLRFLLASLLVFVLGVEPLTVQAQESSLPAEVNKSFSPLSIPAGGISRLSITIFNPNSFVLNNASWTDNLVGVQPGLILASPVNLSNSCGGTVNATARATTLSLSGGTVPAQVGATPGECSVSVDVTSNTAGNLINTIPTGGLTATGNGFSITNTTPASATLRVGGTETPSVSKSFLPSTVWLGQVSQLSIVINNSNPTIPLTAAILADTLPAKVLIASPVTSSLTGCGGAASVSASANGNSVTLNNGSIAPNSTCTIQVNVFSLDQGSYNNTIPAGALKTHEGLTNSSSAAARLNVQAVGMSKAFSSGSISAGGTATLTITLQNPTGTPYRGVNVSDTLPGTVLTVVAGSAKTTCGGTAATSAPRTVSLSGGVIPAGSSAAPGTCTITVQVTAPDGAASGSFRNLIPAGALTTIQGISNLLPAAATIIVAGTDVIASKSFSPTTIGLNENTRLRIDYTAPGDTDLAHFSIVDDLPKELKISNSTSPTADGCGADAVLTANTGESSISLTNGTIAAGTRCRITVYVTGTVPGTYTNTIPPSNITNDQNRVPTSSLTSTVTVSGSTELSIEVVKGFDPVQVFGGSASTMTVQLINPNITPLTNVSFTDDMSLLGAGMILANPANLDIGNCGGTLTGSPGDDTFSFSGGTLPANGTCSLTLSVTMNVNGNLTNVIPAHAVTSAEGASNPQKTEASLTNLPGVSVSKAFSPNPITRGNNSQLTITVRNTSNVLVTGMSLVDDLTPSGLKIAGSSAPAPTTNCNGTLTASAGTQTIELINGVLVGNSVCTIVVSVTGSTSGSFQNTIPAGAIKSVGGITNNQPASDTLLINDPSSDGGGNPGGNNENGTTVKRNNQPSIAGSLIPVTGFAPHRETIVESLRVSYISTDLTLEIPALKLNVPIVGIPLQSGKWNLDWLRYQAGWLNQTAFPTFAGNSVITGHNITSDGFPGPFARLKDLKVGDYIFVYFGEYRYTYKVISTSLVSPYDRTVFQHEDKSWITLVTCDNYDEKTGTYLKRVVVRSELIDIELK